MTDWLKNKQSIVDSSDVGVAKSLQHLTSPGGRSASTTSSYDIDSHDEDEEDPSANSLTKRLAETAVGVREMSKQLGEL